MPTRPKPIAKTKLVNGERVPIATTVTDTIADTSRSNGTTTVSDKIDYTYRPQTETADQYNLRIEKARGSSPTMEESGFTTPTLQTDSAADLFAKQYQKDATQTIDQGKIRQNYISQFQDQINALNQIYDQQLSKAQKEGVGRIGSGTAILARRGLSGSPRGEAIKEGVLDQNRGIEGAIQAERSAAISQIYGKATELSQKEAAERRAAKEAGATKYLEYLKGQDTRKASNLNTVVSALLAQGVDPSEMSADELSAIGKQIGVDGKSLLGSYKVAKYTFDAEQAKAQAEADRQAIKDNSFSLSEGQSRYSYDPETGTYNLIASKAKTYAPSSGGGGGTGVLNANSALVNQPGYSSLTSAQKKAADSLNNLVRSVDDYYAHVRDNANGFGTDLTGASSAVTSSKLNGILFAAAQAEGTGALQKADREVITQMFPDPSSLSSLGAVFRGGKAGQLKAIKEQRDKYAENLAGYGLTPVAGGTPANTPVDAPADNLVEVMSPEGVEGTVPESELDDYINQGYTQL